MAVLVLYGLAVPELTMVVVVVAVEELTEPLALVALAVEALEQ
jgi:hypothetical protein